MNPEPIQTILPRVYARLRSEMIPETELAAWEQLCASPAFQLRCATASVAIPALVAEVRRLQEEVRRLRGNEDGA